MPPRSKKPDPLSETPFWRTRGFVLGMAAAALLAVAGGTIWLVKINQRQQMQWRLEDDPTLSGYKLSLTKEIAAAKPGQLRAPVALWLGRIKKFTEGQRTDGSAPISLLELEGVHLLAGARGPKETGDALAISGKQHIWGGPKPKPGEVWMIAVWRDGDTLAIHTAIRTSLK